MDGAAGTRGGEGENEGATTGNDAHENAQTTVIGRLGHRNSFLFFFVVKLTYILDFLDFKFLIEHEHPTSMLQMRPPNDNRGSTAGHGHSHSQYHSYAIMASTYFEITFTSKCERSVVMALKFTYWAQNEERK